jgi:fucose permease
MVVAVVPAVFVWLYSWNPIPAMPLPAEPAFQRLLKDFKSPQAVMFALLLFFQFGNEWAVAGWLPLYLVQRLGISPASALVMLCVYWLALVAGRFVVFFLLPSVNRGKMLGGCVLAALFGCTILMATNNRFGAVTGILMVGGGFASIYPLVAEKISGRFAHYHPGFYNGIFSFALTGGLLAPWSLGLLVDQFGIRIVMGLPFVGTLMVFVLLVLIRAEAKFRESTNRAA